MKKSKIAVLALSLGLLLGGVTSVQGNFNKNRDIKPDFRIQPKNVVLKRGLKDIVNIIISEVYITKFR